VGLVGRTLDLDRGSRIGLERGERVVFDRARPRAFDGVAYLGAQGGRGHRGIVPATTLGRRYQWGPGSPVLGSRRTQSLLVVNEIAGAWAVMVRLV
jgi:hypothetical protein